MRKKIISALLAAVTVISSLSGLSFGTTAAGEAHSGLVKSYTGTENEAIIYDFVKRELAVNDAAAAGILANLYCESTYKPTAQATEADGSISYGICQWNKVRHEALKTYCADNGYDYTSLTGQLYYLKYELETSEKRAFERVKNVTNDVEGAYEAGYNWAMYFERCASVYYNQRAALTRDSFWPIYGIAPDSLVARGIKYPVSVKSGGFLSAYGSVASPYELTRVDVAIKDASGGQLYGYNYRADGTKKIDYFDVHDADNILYFNKLADGSYIYSVYAEDARGYVVSFEKTFQVGAYETSYLESGEQSSYHDHDRYAAYSWDAGYTVFDPSVEEEGLAIYTCYCGESKTETIPMLSASYTVKYDGMGGTDVPLSQGKAHDKPLTLRYEQPVKEGHTFLGWTTSADSAEVIYAPGGIYDGNESITLYAVWRDDAVHVTGVTISWEERTVYPDESFALTATVMPDNATNKNVVWISSDTSVLTVDASGNVTTVGAGMATVTVQTEDGSFVSECRITVMPRELIYGDINGDGIVSSKDLTRLMKLIAGEDVAAFGADLTGDESVNPKDLTRLMKLIAGLI